MEQARRTENLAAEAKADATPPKQKQMPQNLAAEAKADASEAKAEAFQAKEAAGIAISASTQAWSLAKNNKIIVDSMSVFHGDES